MRWLKLQIAARGQMESTEAEAKASLVDAIEGYMQVRGVMKMPHAV